MDIFVGGLSESVTDEGLEKTFGVYGKVNSVKLVRDRHSETHRGFGYVDMPVGAEATAAIAGLNGRSRLGSSLEVHEILRPGPRALGRHAASRMSPSGTRRQATKAPTSKS